MKLLFDHNLSPRLVKRLADLHPDSSHVFALGFEKASDAVLWERARQDGYTNGFGKPDIWMAKRVKKFEERA